MNHWTSGGAGLTLGFVAGAGVATLLAVDTGPTPPLVEPTEVVTVTRAPSAPDGASPAPPGDSEALAECREQLALAQGLWDRSLQQASGEPVAFPDGIAEALRPVGFENAIEEVLAACPELGMELHFVDCEEYPCTAWLSNPEQASLRSCGAFIERFGEGFAAETNQRIPTEAGDVSTVGIGPYAVDGPVMSKEEKENLQRRLKQRFEVARQQLFDELGGIELTEVQQLERKADLWREAAEGNAAAAKMLERVEAELAAARAASR